MWILETLEGIRSAIPGRALYWEPQRVHNQYAPTPLRPAPCKIDPFEHCHPSLSPKPQPPRRSLSPNIECVSLQSWSGQAVLGYLWVQARRGVSIPAYLLSCTSLLIPARHPPYPCSSLLDLVPAHPFSIPCHLCLAILISAHPLLIPSLLIISSSTSRPLLLSSSAPFLLCPFLLFSFPPLPLCSPLLL